MRRLSTLLGIDDAATECDLDDFEHFDLTIHNNGDAKEALKGVESVLEAVAKLT